MTQLVHQLLQETATRSPSAEALTYQGQRLSYHELAVKIHDCAQGLLKLGLRREDRVAVYLEKRIETVVGLFAAATVGGVFVPVNPLLKPEQVAYIFSDCNVRVLVTSADRLKLLIPALSAH